MKPPLFAKDGDLSVLAEIHAAAFAESWTARALAELLASPGTFAFHTEDSFILARVAASEAEILTLAVRPDRRRHGSGAALVCAAADEAMVRGAGHIFLEVALGNTAARALYTGLGFVIVGQRKGYYASGPDKREDALILRSNLPLPPLGKRPEAG
jgi:[ribosomal protein S18]-alanine N-acetyltransferase